MTLSIKDALKVRAEADCLYTEAELQQAINNMAQEIIRDLADKSPIVFSVMNGGLIFTGQLLPKLDFPLEVSYLHATRYMNETSGGELFWKAKPELSFIDRNVLIVDDILDEGHTLSAIMQYCERAGAKAVYSAVLIDKDHGRKAFPGFKANYTGLTCKDRFIFGYGMDYKGYWRNAPGIFAVKGL